VRIPRGEAAVTVDKFSGQKCSHWATGKAENEDEAGARRPAGIALKCRLVFASAFTDVRGENNPFLFATVLLIDRKIIF
jgi:hypothetical protein